MFIMSLGNLNYDQIEVKECAINFDTPNRKEILKNGLRTASYENLLGRGTFGLVFKAIYKGKQVAVKIINNQNNFSHISAVKNEMNVLNWEHKNIIRILYIEFQSTHSAIIMERFAGLCLQSILDQVELSLQHRFRISKDIICGLNFCHSKGILHLDIKPQNILIAFKKECNMIVYSHYTCKICDFGSSQQIFLENNFTFESLSRVPTGTIRYMSPEALKNEPLTTASDIFSFGITMWQLKSRKPPYFKIDCNDTVAYKVVKNNLRPSTPTEKIDNCFQFKNSHKNCLCRHFSSEVQKKLKENSFYFEFLSENCNKILSSSQFCKLQKPSISNENFTADQFRRTFKYTNRKLLFPNVNNTSLGAFKFEGSSNNKADNFDLHRIFLKKQQSECGLKEDFYKAIYSKCWSTNPEARPSGVQIENQIRKFLN